MINLSLSALTPSQYRPYMKMFRPDPELLKLFQKISGKTGHQAMRLYFDLNSEKILKTATSVECPPNIKQYLEENGFAVFDYASGIVKDKHGRDVRLGKALKDPTLKKEYETDPGRKALVTATKGKKSVCLSMHPYDVAGMSTGRGWTSCMNLNDGSNRLYVADDVRKHTLIAYMIDASDRDIKKPLARVLIKRFFSSGNKLFFYHVERVYPSQNLHFTDAVQEFVNENINKPLIGGKALKGLFEIDDELYDDAGVDLYPQLSYPDTPAESVKEILASEWIWRVKDTQWPMLARRFGPALFDMIFLENRLTDREFSDEIIMNVVNSLKASLPVGQFKDTLLKIIGFLIRAGTQDRLVLALQIVLDNKSEPAFKLLAQHKYFLRTMLDFGNRVSNYKIETTEKQRKDYLKFVVQMIRAGNVPEKPEVALAQWMSYMFSTEKRTPSALLKEIEQYKDIIPVDRFIKEFSHYYGLDSEELMAYKASANPAANSAIKLTPAVLISLQGSFTTDQIIELGAALGTEDMMRMGSKLADDKEFRKALMPALADKNVGIHWTYESKGFGILYPTTKLTGQQTRAAFQQAIDRTIKSLYKV